MKNGWLGLIFSMLFIPMLFSFILINGVTNAYPLDPKVSLSLENDTIMADISNVTSVNPTIVTFTGWVSVDFNPSTTVVVELSVTDTWQLSSIAPTNLQFSENNTEKKKFTVEVKIPYVVDCDETGQVTIFSGGTLYPGGRPVSSSQVIGKILIEKYHKFRVSNMNKHKEIRPGDDITMSFSIWNNGNGEEFFITTIKNLDELREEGFNIDQPKPVKALPDESAQVVISIDAPSDLPENELYYVEIEVKPEDKIHGDVPTENFTISLKTLPGSSLIWANIVCSAFTIIVIAVIITILILIYRIIKSRKK